MNQLKVYQILEHNGFPKDAAQELVKALNENEELATKGDLKELGSALRLEMREMKIDILKEMNLQTWKFMGGLAALGVLFKLADMVIQHVK